MGRERLFQLLIALGAALGLAALGLARAGTGALAQGTRSTPMASVVVARTDLAAGTVLSPALVAVRRLPAPDVPPGAFAAPSQVSGAVAKEAVFAGEPLVAGMLYPSLAASALPDQLPQGMRALDLAVSSVSGVGGLLVPGDRVDLVATLPSPRGGTEATLLVQDVPILMTVGGSGTASPFGSPAASPGYTSVILEVTPRQAAAVVLAQTQGALTLLLRPSTDRTVTAPVVVTVPSLEGGNVP